VETDGFVFPTSDSDPRSPYHSLTGKTIDSAQILKI